MIRQVEYFEKPGRDNTQRCIEIAEELVSEGHKHIVVATTGGDTALAFGRRFHGKDVNLVAVTHNVGYLGPNKDELTPEIRSELRNLGVKVYTGPILTRGIEGALMKKFQGVSAQYVVALTLRMFSQGVKVAVEIIAEACDAGLIPEDEDVIAVAGTGRGADTVALIEAHSSDRFFDIKVKQLPAKPL